MNGDNKLFKIFRSVIEIRLKKWKERMEEKKKTKLEKKIKKNVIFYSFKNLGLIRNTLKLLKYSSKMRKNFERYKINRFFFQILGYSIELLVNNILINYFY